jgi:hypothetical protein
MSLMTPLINSRTLLFCAAWPKRTATFRAKRFASPDTITLLRLPVADA